MKKRILYFMPDNPTVGKAGNLTRSVQLLDFLHSNIQNYEYVEFLSVGDWGEWTKEGIANFQKKYPGIKLHLINRKTGKSDFIKRLFLYKLPNFIPKLLRGTSVDITNYFFTRAVKKHFNSGKYDTIIMSYTSWGSLIANLDYKPYLIIDTHDFMTAQNRKKKNKIGRLFQTELNILRKFDEIWTLSIEEKFIYEQFTDCRVVYHPVLFPHRQFFKKEHIKYDIIYVASSNPHNITSINWFLKKVCPLLSAYTIHIVGRICKEIHDDYPNVIKHGLVDDIDEMYQKAKIAICPMLSGTGVKIKVIEALSYHLPVVTNTRGVDGLLNKTVNGCLVSDDEIAFANHIKLIMKNDEVYEKLRLEASDYINQNHSVETEAILFSSLI